MRIAHLTATFPPYQGGAGNVCSEQARGLAARGHSVEVFTATAEGEQPDAGAAVVHRMAPRMAIGNAPLLPELARLRGFDVVHLHYPFIFGVELALLALARQRSTALAITHHNALIGDGARAPLFAGYEATWGRAVAARADRVCALSFAHADSVSYLRRLRARHPDRVVELPNGVDSDVFAPGPDDAGDRAPLGLPADAIVVGLVATLDRAHHFKRVDLAIEALADVHDERLHLLVVGDGELRAGYESQAAAAGLGERVRFAGAIGHDRLPALLRACDALVMCSQEPESFGLVIAEAMATGIPTLISDLPGPMTVAQDGVTGLSFQRGNATALADGLVRLAALGREGRAAMGAAGRARAQEHFAWPGLIGRLEAVYGEALRRRASITSTR